jgi:hypothetical protein
MSTSAPKKPKMANDNYDFETVKRYLLECPHVPPENPAIKAALEGLLAEQQRRERDVKLQRKFARESNATVTTSLEDSVVMVNTNTGTGTATPPPSTASASPDLSASDEMMQEWHDLADNDNDDKKEEDEGRTSFLGKKLAKLAIDSISEHQVKVKSPVAAIAVVFHATLWSDLVGFSCTGIPQDESSSSSLSSSSTSNNGGFAAPVRELPKSLFLPPQWDSQPQKVSLRYRKNGTGAIVLTVQEEPADRTITVRLQPASSKEPSSQSLSFSLGDHVNLDSWNAALKASSSIPPALHYKSLAVLLTNFCRTFDFGSVEEPISEGQAPYVDNTVSHSAAVSAQSIHKFDFVPPQPIPNMADEWNQPSWDDQARVPTTLGEAFPGILPMAPAGHFAGDLAPAGLRDPRFAGLSDGRMGGNLMGPNHPMFSSQGGPTTSGMHPHHGGPPFLGGPGSMQPRFDPFYPPGVNPDDLPAPPGRNRPSRTTGEPNPDHLPPPNSFGGDMFS